MNKIYKLLIECAEFPIGTEAREGTNHNIDTPLPYHLFVNDEKVYYGIASRAQIENRPNVWELQEEKIDLRSPEAEKMREESRATRFDFIPKDQCHYYVYDFENNCVYGGGYWRATSGEIACWGIGFVKSTRDEAMKHGEKYARYFLTE